MVENWEGVGTQNSSKRSLGHRFPTIPCDLRKKKAAVIPKSLPICKKVALGRTKDSIDPWSHGPWFGCCEEENTWGAIVSGLGNRSNLQGIKLTRGIYHHNNVSQRHMQSYCQAVFIPGVKSVRDEAMKKGKKCAEKGKEKSRSCYGLADRSTVS